MVSTKSMKAAEKAAQAAGRNTEAGDVDLDGVVTEDVTELEAVKLVVHEHSDALARLEEGLARVQADAKADADDLRQRLENLMRAIASLQAKGDGSGGAPILAESAIEGGGATGAAETAATAAGGCQRDHGNGGAGGRGSREGQRRGERGKGGGGSGRRKQGGGHQAGPS
ncbi:unnamed protein product [Linum trigynum]|uniref:Uncharacterized protein n=1 Tax=Linum trigynum TaxID=586398 RepID=A0AAV2G9W4_9ROSI